LEFFFLEIIKVGDAQGDDEGLIWLESKVVQSNILFQQLLEELVYRKGCWEEKR
jgi:hypothetical protein